MYNMIMRKLIKVNDNLSLQDKKNLLKRLDKIHTVNKKIRRPRVYDTKKIKTLQNVSEYYDFIKSLQTLTSFPGKYNYKKHTWMPYWKADKTGVYIINKLSSSGKVRKFKLAIALLKEEANLNLACYKIDNDNNIMRARDVDGNFYVVLDHEMCICGDIGLFREFFKTPTVQGLNAVFLTVFPMQISIARLILKDNKWSPNVRYRGGILYANVGVDGDMFSSDINSIDVKNFDDSKLGLSMNIEYNRMNDNNTQVGTGSGIGIVKDKFVKEIVKDPPQNVSILEEELYSLRPTVVFTENDIDPLPVGAYDVFQVAFLGNDKNMRIISNSEKDNGKLIFDNGLHVLFDGKKSIPLSE